MPPDWPIYVTESELSNDGLTGLLLEAMARVTGAFRELSAEVLAGGDVDIETWMSRWRLGRYLGNRHLSERIASYVWAIERAWIGDHEAAKRLKIDYWRQRDHRFLPRLDIVLGTVEWDPCHEPYDSYYTRVGDAMHANVESFLADQKLEGNRKLDRFLMSPWLTRTTKSNLDWRFEWLVLSIQGYSPSGMKARNPEYRRVRDDAIAKSVFALKQRMGITVTRRGEPEIRDQAKPVS